MKQRSLSLGWRMILLVAGIPLLFLIPIFLFFGQRYRQEYREAWWSKGEVVTTPLQQMIESVAPFIVTLEDVPGLSEMLRGIVATSNVPRPADTTAGQLRMPEGMRDEASARDFEFIALVDEYGRVIEHSQPGVKGEVLAPLQGLDRDVILFSDDPKVWAVGPREFTGGGAAHGDLYLVVRAMPMPGEVGRRLYIVVGERTELVNPDLWPLVLIGFFTAAVVVLLIRYSLRRLVLDPLQTLAAGTAVVGGGDLSHRINLQRDDELGLVAQAFNEMSERLRTMVSGLEQRVHERTGDLERRNRQLEAVTLVGQQANRQRDVNTLLETATRAISDNFEFYHTGIFILDSERDWAILRAASSEGGQRMLNRGHRLQVGQVGIVGYVAATGEPRIAFDVGEDATWFNNPDLPMTRSEMALPLLSEDIVIGVLDVQSEEPAAFTTEDIRTLQLVADQLAIALTNARMLETMEATLAELRDVQTDYSNRGWARVARRSLTMAYEYDGVETSPVPLLPVPVDLSTGRVEHKIIMDGDMPVVMEALRAGDRVLGYLGLADRQREWSGEELSLVRAVGEQVALALENARLFQDTQRNERQQYLISQVLQIASNPEYQPAEVLQEIATVLAQGLDMAVVIFTFPSPNQPLAHPHAVVDPQGRDLPLLSGDIELTQEHHIFLRGLSQPELGPMNPLLPPEIVSETGTILTFGEEYDEALANLDLERVLYVPISSAGAQSGFIGLIQGVDDAPLDPDTRELAHSLASQIAVVLDNLSLTEDRRQRSEELRTLYQISLTLSQLQEPEEVLHTLVERGVELLGADAGNLWVYEPDLEELALTFDYQDGSEGRLGHRLSRGEGLAGLALEQREPLPIADYATWEGRVGALTTSRFRAMMAVPLVGRFGPLGVLVVLARQAAFFDERAAGLAQLFSNQAAAALENARLTQDAEQRAQEYSQLYDAGIDLITILETEELLSRAADWARRVFDAERAILFFRDEQLGRYIRGHSVSDPRYEPDFQDDQPSKGGLTDTMIQTRANVFIPDNRTYAASSARRLAEQGMLSQMGVPLLVGEEVLGALFVNGAQVGQFTERDLNLLEFLAAQVSSALQNSLQLEATERALSVVERQAVYQQNVSQAVAELTRSGVAGAIEEVLRLLAEAAEVGVAVYFAAAQNAQGVVDHWRMQHSWIAPDRRDHSLLQDERLQHLPVDALPLMAAHLQEHPTLIARRSELPPAERRMLEGFEFDAMLALRVTGEGEYPGFLAFLREGQALWEEQDVVALQTAAAALSNTMARERLFSQVEATLEETEALYRGGAALSEADTYQGILNVLLEHTVLGEGSQHVTLQLFDRFWTAERAPEYSQVVAERMADDMERMRYRYNVTDFSSGMHFIERGNPTYIEDLTDTESAEVIGLGRRGRALFSRALGASSLVIVPLVVGGQRIGYLHADYEESRTFSGRERRRLNSLAQQASIAVLNIRQLRATEARVRREQLIRQITGRIQEAPDVEGVLQNAVRELGRAFGTSRNRVQFRPPREARGNGGDSDGAAEAEAAGKTNAAGNADVVGSDERLNYGDN